MSPELIEAQIRGQALGEAWRSAIVETQAQRLKAQAQQATYEAAMDHVKILERQFQEANAKVAELQEKDENMRRMSGVLARV